MSLQQVDWGDGTAIYSGPIGQTIPDHVYATNGAKSLVGRIAEADNTEVARTTGQMTVPPGSVTSVAPTGGPPVGGTEIVLSGSALTGTTQVYVGATLATGVQTVNDSTVRAITPAGTPGALVNVNAMTRGVATNAAQYQYAAAEEEEPDEGAAARAAAPITSQAARGAPRRRGR